MRSSTAWRSSRVEERRSLPLGKYWRRSPLVFSFVPRSHGLAGGAKKMPSAKYSSSRWWQAISEPWSQVRVCRARSGRPVNTGSIAMRMLGAVAVGQVHQAQVTGAPVDQGADGRAAGPADDEVSLPVADPSALLDHRRSGVDQPARRDEPRRARHRAAPAPAHSPSGAELLGQRPAQAALPAVVEGLVDGLVAQMPLRPVRIGRTQMRRDLRRTPLLSELVV